MTTRRRDPDMTPVELAEALADARPKSARERCEELRAQAERAKTVRQATLLESEADRIETAARAVGKWENE